MVFRAVEVAVLTNENLEYLTTKKFIKSGQNWKKWG